MVVSTPGNVASQLPGSPSLTGGERIAFPLDAPAPSAKCWVSINPSAPGERLVVPFPASCGLESIVVNLPNATETLNLTIEHLWSWPEGVPAPDMATPPALVFEAVLRDANGTVVQPSSALVQVRVPEHWLKNCPADTCRPELFHYHDGAWNRHELQQVDQANGTAIMQAETNGFSLFAVGGVNLATPSKSFNVWPWLLGAFAVGATLWVRRRSRPSDRAKTPVPAAASAASPDSPVQMDVRVSRLLTEMRNKEELLQFVNNAAHDLANPLTPIQLQLDLLTEAAQESDDERQKKSLAVVQRNVEQLGLLITDLRDASKLQAGKIRLSLEPLDLPQLAREAAESYQEQAAAARVDLVVDAADPLPVEADSGRLTQVLTNFLNNALKFTPRGGNISVHVAREGDDALVLVRDTGLGLTPEDQARLFKPFSQVHGEQEKKKGTGLGLFIAKGIVEAHGGRIGCTSEGPGKGSTFWFAVPLKAAKTDATSPPDGPDPVPREKP